MKYLSKKIPRGIIYHKLGASIGDFFKSLLFPLNNKKRIYDFESAFADFCERQHCVAFPFARTAIYFVLKNLDLPKGSEVILSAITIKGIVDVVVDQGLIPVYVEMDPETMNWRLDELEKRVGANVRAAIITPLFGLVPDIQKIVDLLKKRGVFIIEDFSQCLNGCFDGKRIGTFGDVGVYSSSSIKTLDTLGGGLAITDNDEIYQKLRNNQKRLYPANRPFLVKKAWVNLVRNLATTNPWFSFLTFPVLQFVRKRDPNAALKQTGHRDQRRLTELPGLWFHGYTSVQADIGLKKLDAVKSEDRIRIENVNFIKSHCSSARFPVTTGKSDNIYWQLILLVKDSHNAQTFFANEGVDVATSSLELVCALKEYPNCTNLPMATNIHQNGVFIPCFPGLTSGELLRIAELTDSYCAQHCDHE